MEITPSLHRSRLLMYAQLSDDFLIVSNLGMNGLTPGQLDPLGYNSQRHLFLHDAWIEFKVTRWLYIGSGLHYWNGISRLTNQSTLNFLPIDNPRFAWATLGTTDQFARHLGVYAKGKIGKLDYRLAWNKAMTYSFDRGRSLFEDQAMYRGAELAELPGVKENAGNIYQGYFMYQFLDQESNKLPYMAGTYLGKKTVFNIGAGVYFHGNGSVTQTVEEDNGVQIPYRYRFGMMPCILLLMPFSTDLSVTRWPISALVAYYSFDYGPNYMLGGSSQVVATGSTIYGQLGLLLPKFTNVGRWQPYVTFANRGVEALDGNLVQIGAGLNYLISGHNAKVSLEFRNQSPVDGESSSEIIMQAVVFL